MRPRVVGLDLSLTATGVADDDGVRVIRVKLAEHATQLERTQRLRGLGVEIDRQTRDADLVVLEGHSFNSKNTHAHSLGELHGIVKVCLLQRKVPFVVVAPALLKKWATGKGNAGKDAVLAACVRDGFPGEDNNAADAWTLRRIGLFAYGPLSALPRYRQEVIGGLRWPSIEEREVAG